MKSVLDSPEALVVEAWVIVRIGHISKSFFVPPLEETLPCQSVLKREMLAGTLPIRLARGPFVEVAWQKVSLSEAMDHGSTPAGPASLVA